METGCVLYGHLHKSPSASSPPIPANLNYHSRRRFHHQHHQNVRRQLNFTMPLRDFTLRRITANQYHHFRFNHPREPFCITNHFAPINLGTMAEESKKKDSLGGKLDQTTVKVSKSEEENDKTPEKSTPAIPPPPEKPLPGDCCGSGCVRCVWDAYYEELEEYNKLYKADPKIS